MRNIKLILEYDGTNYHGWQSQTGTGRPTIQDALEQAIKTITGEQARTASSGRTDAGVHAFGHVANFSTGSTIPSEAWAPALNHVLPQDIRVQTSEEVPSDFHSRFSAIGKIYRYRILNRRGPSALLRNYAWHIPQPLNLRQMRSASACLLGEHDFSTFRSSSCTAKTTVRTLQALTISKKGESIEVLLEANAFLMHMARNIVGTLVDVGLGKYPVDEVKQMLMARDRKRGGRTAPSCGLYLLKVHYR